MEVAMTSLCTVALDENMFLSLSTFVLVLSEGWWLARKIQSLETAWMRSPAAIQAATRDPLGVAARPEVTIEAENSQR